jgi:hypothetical protein
MTMINRLISICKDLCKPIYNYIDFKDDYLLKNMIQDKTDRYEIVMNIKEGYDGFIVTIQLLEVDHCNLIKNLIEYLRYNHNKKYLDSISIEEPIISTNYSLANRIIYHISSNVKDSILVYIGNDKEKLYYFLKINCNNTKVVISEDVEILLSSKLYFNVFVFYNENISNISEEYVTTFIDDIFHCKFLLLICCRSNITKIKILI